MIISASRRTDIPAYFGEWFAQRIRAGSVQSINPFNPKQIKTSSLHTKDVDAVVFWTKNPAPFLRYLPVLDDQGYSYYFLFTLNHYPALFEPNLPSLEERIGTFEVLSDRIGRERVVWRYDPIVISSVTPVEYHIDTLGRLAERLKGSTGRLMISFLDFYRKVRGRLAPLEGSHGISFTDIIEESCRAELHGLARAIGQIGRENSLGVYTCAEDADLGPFGIDRGSCVDGDLIRRLFQMDKTFPRDRKQRKGCGCAASVDIGVYNTCPANCVYCYANLNQTIVKKNLQRHHAESPTLIPI